MYLVDGDGFGEALIAGSAAARTGDAIVLLTRGAQLPDATRDALDRYDGAEVVAVGPQAAAAASGRATRAIVGEDVYETAQLLAAELPSSIPTVALASGEAFPDGLAGGAHAAQRGVPLLLTRRDSLPPSTQQAITSAGATSLIVYGGTAAISDAVTRAALGPPPLPVTTMVVGTAGQLLRLDTGTGATQPLVATAGDFPAAADVSPDRTRVVYVQEFSSLWTVAADGSGGATQVATVPPGGDYTGFGTVAWAPDGTRFAVVVDRQLPDSFPTLCSDIWIYAADGSDGRPVHNAGGVMGADRARPPPPRAVTFRLPRAAAPRYRPHALPRGHLGRLVPLRRSLGGLARRSAKASPSVSRAPVHSLTSLHIT